MLWDALGSFDALESIRVTQVILGIKGLFLMREVENPQNQALCSISGVVEGCGGRLKPREVENPQNRALCLISGVVEGGRSPGRSKTPKTEHCARFRGLLRVMEGG